jgi:hypothetical protein
MKKFNGERSMTWKQAAPRRLTLVSTATPPRIGPGSYSLPAGAIPLAKYRNAPLFRQERVTLPPPDIVTPGPGAYTPSEKNPSTPNCFFRSGPTRTLFSFPPGSATYPSPADHGRLVNWPGGRVSVPHSRAMSKVPHLATFWKPADQRTVNGALSSKSFESAGDVSDVDEGAPLSRYTTINCSDRHTDTTGAQLADNPGPDSYVLSFADSRIPRVIGERREIPNRSEFSELTSPRNPKMPTRPHSVFQSSFERQPFGSDPENVPAPGTYVPRTGMVQKPQSRVAPPFGTGAVQSDRSHATPSPGPVYDLQSPTIERKAIGTSHFRSKSVPLRPIESTTCEVGPGRYSLVAPKVVPRKSPAFADGSDRDMFIGDGLPGPSDYNLEKSRIKPMLVHGMRHPVIGDWAFSVTSDAPSPENYTIDRELVPHAHLFPKSPPPNDQQKPTIGPGAYHRPGSLIKKSYNSGVPRAVRAV